MRRAPNRPVLLGLLLATAGAAPTAAQEAKPTQDELLAAKLVEPFLQRAPWRLDWDEALAAASSERRLLFAYFTTVNH
jgi:hypothetical protein